MEKKSLISCIDAGTENCPCFLALTGDCLTCSRLQNKDCCDCAWTGACIYNEFMLAGKRINNPRKETVVRIVQRIIYEDDLTVYILDVGKGFAIKSSVPGSYIFMKNALDTSFYDVPISIMQVDAAKGWIYVAVKTISTKTKMLAMAQNTFTIRGPYRNGLIGIKQFEQIKGKTLLICRGVGVAPAVLTAGFFCGPGRKAEGEEIHVIVDTEKTNAEMTLDYLQNLPVKIKYLKLASPKDEQEIQNQLRNEKYEKVGIFASDYFISKYGRLAKKEINDVALAVSNNFNICCGEGVCGACTRVNEKGEAIKMCKCQIAAEDTFRVYQEQGCKEENEQN